MCLNEITRGGLQIFFVCLVGVWQRNFEPAMCVYGRTGWELVSSPSYRRFKITLPNTDQAHEKYL